jgi:hypothetical protein
MYLQMLCLFLFIIRCCGEVVANVKALYVNSFVVRD